MRTERASDPGHTEVSIFPVGAPVGSVLPPAPVGGRRLDEVGSARGRTLNLPTSDLLTLRIEQSSLKR